MNAQTQLEVVEVQLKQALDRFKSVSDVRDREDRKLVDQMTAAMNAVDCKLPIKEYGGHIQTIWVTFHQQQADLKFLRQKIDIGNLRTVFYSGLTSSVNMFQAPSTQAPSSHAPSTQAHSTKAPFNTPAHAVGQVQHTNEGEQSRKRVRCEEQAQPSARRPLFLTMSQIGKGDYEPVEHPKRSGKYYTMECPICIRKMGSVQSMYMHVAQADLAHLHLFGDDKSFRKAAAVCGIPVIDATPEDVELHKQRRIANEAEMVTRLTEQAQARRKPVSTTI